MPLKEKDFSVAQCSLPLRKDTPPYYMYYLIGVLRPAHECFLYTTVASIIVEGKPGGRLRPAAS